MEGSAYNTFATYYHRPEMDRSIFSFERFKYYCTSINGRISRAEYIAAIVMIYGAMIALGFALILFTTASFSSGNLVAGFGALGTSWLLYGAVWLMASVAGFIAAAKRAHDRNRSGWFVLLYFVPLLCLWPLVELIFLQGTAGDNLYGNDPLVRFGVALSIPPQGFAAPAPQPAAQHVAPSGSVTQSPPSQRVQMNPRLLGVTGEYANMTIPVDASGMVLGRDVDRCNLVLNSSDVSRVHARVSFDFAKGQFLLEDMGSTNGVFIGQSKVNGAGALAPGQTFRLGQGGASFTALC